MSPSRAAAPITRLVATSARHPRRTLGIVGALVLLALIGIAQGFAMTTDTSELIAARTPWRADERAVESRFPALKDPILVVIDGATPEIAQAGADRLAAALRADRQRFALVRQPDGGAFFAREGLLFQTAREVQASTQRLIDAQPLLGPLAADPSLRGIAQAIETVASGAARGRASKADRLAEPLAAMSAAIDARLAGRPAFFSWQAPFAAGSAAPPTRKLIIAQPHLAFGALEPGAAAVSAVRREAAVLGIDAAHGGRVSITGAVPLADEEFASIRDNIGVVGLIMLAAMSMCLWAAVRAVPMVLAILGTTAAGLVLTLAAGLLAVHRLNLISVAFIPLFVGLGVDFGIQLSVRFNAERARAGDARAALTAAAQGLGEPLLIAAGAIVLALAAFLPTQYTGIAELGVIAGIGMALALALTLTLLPALLALIDPRPPRGPVGWAPGALADRWLARHRGAVLLAFGAAMVGSIALLPAVRFDFNPMHLRDPAGPAMRALADLTRDPDRTPDTVEALAPNLGAADALAARLSRLPQVAHAVTLASFVPEDQPAKLALISDASLLLDPVLNPLDLAPPADDRTTVAALARAQASLATLAHARPGGLGDAATRLARSFARLSAATPAARAEVGTMLTAPLATTLDGVRAALSAAPVTRDSLPPDLRSDWLAPDGSALVSVTPRVPAGEADNAALAQFTAAVRAIAPHATGLPVATQAAARTVAEAFIDAGVLALVLVSALLWLVLRSAREVAFTLAPVVLSGFLTMASCVVLRVPLNFANIIAFPLLFGVGVAFHIYFVMAWRDGTTGFLQTPLARAVVWSALATGSAFGALAFSHHRGTASMGLILMIALVWTLVCALVFEPALLGPGKAE